MIPTLRLTKKKIVRAQVALLRHFYAIKPLRRIFWEVYADEIYANWGQNKHDYSVLSDLIDDLKPCSILDAGCGTGRLFPLYIEKKLVDITGVDISYAALSIAKKEFPQVTIICSPLEDIDFGGKIFDLSISNRTLQHVPPDLIDLVIKKICLCSHYVYINETIIGETVESRSLFQHDYEQLFQANDLARINTGSIGNQRYHLFSRFTKE